MIVTMIEPRITAGIEQEHDFPTSRINRGEVGAFLEIAVRAGQSEIMGFICPAMLPRDNVFYMKTQLRKLLRYTTVLTTLARPCTDELTQLRVH